MSKRANIPWGRIEARLVELGKDQAWLRSTLGVEANVITNWKSRGAPSKEAVAIAQVLDMSTDQLLGLSYDPAAIPGAMRVIVAEPGDPNFYFIKKVKLQLRAGVTGFQTIPDIYDGDTFSLRKNWVDRNKMNPNTLMALTVAGESMEPNLYDGDIVVIDTADTAMKDGVVYAFNYDGESVIKRLVRERGDWWLFSDNPDQTRHRPKGCRSGDCGIIGRVVKRETDHI